MKILKLIITLLILAALIGVGVLIYTTCSGTPLIQRIDKTLPDDTVAPFQVFTETHLYYARDAIQNADGSVTMSGWYEQNNGRWVLREGSTTIPKVLHPRINRR